MNARPESAQAPDAAPFPVEVRSAVEFAQAAVWDWMVSADQFQVDDVWLRAFGIDLDGGAMPCATWKRRIHPDDLGAFIAAADSCNHGGDRFECEYRLLAAGHRWLWVLHRGRVVQRDQDGSAARITGLLFDIDRRKSEEVARSDSESRLATALWGARAAFWQWHVPSNARTASPLWLAMTGYSRAQWDATPNPWFSNLHSEDREHVDRQLREHAQGMRDSVEFEYRFQTAGGEFRWIKAEPLDRVGEVRAVGQLGRGPADEGRLWRSVEVAGGGQELDNERQQRVRERVAQLGRVNVAAGPRRGHPDPQDVRAVGLAIRRLVDVVRVGRGRPAPVHQHPRSIHQPEGRDQRHSGDSLVGAGAPQPLAGIVIDPSGVQPAIPGGVGREGAGHLEGRPLACCPDDGVAFAALAQAVELPEAESHA